MSEPTNVEVYGYPTDHLAFPVGVADWQGDNVEATLDAVYGRANAAAQWRIDWYNDKADRFGRRAQWLRFGALVFVAIGGLAPLVGAAWRAPFEDPNVPSSTAIGYVALALAGILVAIDNFFGFSTSWMRFRVTQAALIRRLARFRFEWARELAGLATSSTPADTYTRLLDKAEALVDEIERIVQEETESWAERFAARVQAFDRQHEFQRFDAGTGTVEVVLTNPDEVEPDSVVLRIDGRTVTKDARTGRWRATAPAGPVTATVEATAKADGRRLTGEAKGDVEADQLETLRVTASPTG